MTTTYEWDDAAFLAGLRRSLERIELRSARDLQRVGIRVQNEARTLCPVDTGRLRSSIQHKMGEDLAGPFVEVGTNVEYGPNVEFGIGQRPQPFMRPALARVLARGIR